jgi:hypothetical protein
MAYGSSHAVSLEPSHATTDVALGQKHHELGDPRVPVAIECKHELSLDSPSITSELATESLNCSAELRRTRRSLWRHQPGHDRSSSFHRVGLREVETWRVAEADGAPASPLRNTERCEAGAVLAI